jgi:hypothetical protein
MGRDLLTPLCSIAPDLYLGCTLCDKAKEVLLQVQKDHPHSLWQVDITDPEHQEWWDRYKYDIPVLHINGVYWTKHRVDVNEAKRVLTQAKEIEGKGGIFPAQSGQPNASAMERKNKKEEQVE